MLSVDERGESHQYQVCDDTIEYEHQEGVVHAEGVEAGNDCSRQGDVQCNFGECFRFLRMKHADALESIAQHDQEEKEPYLGE
ncbi:hypothetical protein SDC9_82487 [bioreactor metagenome]|uniref:Uncharacterized protein n=1 Tax=bioreactor metagenome TaxID=1076179 RepID=A0A644ZB00_9ZZZZ